MHAFPTRVAVLGLLLGTGASALAQGAPSTNEPLRLSELLSRAVATSPLIEAARSRVRGAQGSRLTARTLGNPLLTYQVDNAPFPGNRPLNAIDRETSIFATFPLEPLFQRWPRTRMADADVRAAEAELDLARRAVSLDAAKTFYRVALAQAAVDGAADVRDRMVELTEYTQARVKEGVTSEGDLIRARVELDRADALLALDQAELMRARGALAPFLGASSQVVVVGSLRVAMDTTVSPAGGASRSGHGALATVDAYVTRAREARPDLRAARARADAARAHAGYQRTLTVRQLGATFGAKRIGDVNTMIAGISVPFPLFDQNRGEIQRADADLSAAELELAWRERQVLAEVAAAHESARLLAAQRARLGDSTLARATEAQNIAIAAYREGATGLLQVIDASRTLGDMRIAYYRTLIAESETRLELEIVSGGEPTQSVSESMPASSTSFIPSARAVVRDGDRQ